MKTLVCYMSVCHMAVSLTGGAGVQTTHGHLVWTSDMFDEYELDKAREEIADTLKCRVNDVVFTSIAMLGEPELRVEVLPFMGYKNVY